MTSLMQLWVKRFRTLMKELGKYSRLIFNDHFSIILFVMLGFFSFYYREQLILLSTVDQSVIRVPIILLAAFMTALFTQIGRPLWLMKEADKSFIYPQGTRWLNYWVRGSLVGLIFPIIMNVVLALLLFPFLALVLGWQQLELILWFVLQVLIVCAQHLLYYLTLFSTTEKWRLYLALGMGIMVAMSLLFMPQFALYGLIVAGFAVIVGLIYQIMMKRHQWFDFEMAQKIDNERESVLYRWLNFFVDIPQKSVPMKRRAYLDGLINRLTTNQNRDVYLFVRLLFRNKGYSGIWLRVLVFIAVMILMTNNPYLIMGLGVIAFYITIVQLLPMIHYYENNPFHQIYPINNGSVTKAIQYVSSIILVIQGIAFAIAALISLKLSLNLTFAIGLWSVVILLLLHGYIPFWIKKNQR